MVKIREIIISGTDYFLDTIIGYDGEHNITNLNIKLSSELISGDIDYYIVKFQTSEGNVIESGHLQQTGGYVVTPIWQQITKSGILKFQVEAWALTGSTINKIAMSPMMSRMIGESVDGDAVLLDEEVSGLMAELQELIANYPVKIGTFTEGEAWDFELINGLLNITYVPSTEGADGLTPEIGENGNWFIGSADTGILGDVNQIDLSGYLQGEYPEEPTMSAFLRDDGQFTEVGSLSNIIVDDIASLPETAEDGTMAIVREIDQTRNIVTRDIDTELSGYDGFQISEQFPQVYFKPHPLKPDFTALGISPQLLLSGWTSTFGSVTPFAEDKLNWHQLVSVDKYDMLFTPEGLLPCDCLIFNDLDWNGIDNTARTKYFYIWDDPGENEIGLVTGWNEITTWDEEENIATSIPVSVIPSMLTPSCCYFEDSAAGLATKAYFETICNDKPFTYRRYLRDNGEWIGESVDGDAVLLNEEVSGLMAELQELIANYPVAMGTSTDGTEWNFELVDGMLNITYVPAVDGDDGFTPEIAENGNWVINGVDTGVLADVNLLDLSDYLQAKYPETPTGKVLDDSGNWIEAGGGSPEYENKWFVSSEIGSDDNDGKSEASAFEMIRKGIENAVSGDVVVVTDSKTYTADTPIIIPNGVTVYMPLAGLKGEIQLGTSSRFIARSHTPSANEQTMVSCIGTSGSSYAVYGMNSTGYSNIIHFKPATVGGYIVSDTRHITVGASTVGNENILVYSTAGSSGVNIATTGANFSCDKALNYGYIANLVYGTSSYAQWSTDVVGLPVTITYDNTSAAVVSSYKIKATSSGTRAPKDWTLYGQLSGGGWELLDTQEDIEWDAYEEKEFTISSTGSYDEYKIIIASATHETRLQIDDMGLWAGVDSVGGDVMMTSQILTLGEYAQGILAHDADQRVVSNINNVYSTGANDIFIEISDGSVSHRGNVVTAETVWDKTGGTLVWDVAFSSGTKTGTADSYTLVATDISGKQDIETVVAYDTVIKMVQDGVGLNTHTTSGAVEFALPTATSGTLGKLALLVKMGGNHAITWSEAVYWAGATNYVFGSAGTHLVTGFYDTLNSKWCLTGMLYGAV